MTVKIKIGAELYDARRLIYKLSNFGISGDLLQWIEAFLTNRQQCVVVEHCFSTFIPVLSGVAQGSVIGPLLFILYVDDIIL